MVPFRDRNRLRRSFRVLALTSITAALAAVLVQVGPARADHPHRGTSMLWVGLNGNRAQLVGPTTGAGNTFENPEHGVHVALSRFVSDEWTIQLAGGFDTGSSDFKPSVLTGGSDQKFTSSSYSLRVGGDRWAFINDRAAIYAGPGILYWHGHGKYAGSGVLGFDGEWPNVDQYGFNGRFGFWARLSGPWALFGHIGQVIATNSAKDDVGKNTWWTSHHEGSVGLSADF